MGNHKLMSFLKRALSSVILIAILLTVIIKGSPLFEIALLIMGIMLAWEWNNIVPAKNKPTYLATYIFAIAIMIFLPAETGIISAIVASVFLFFKAKGEEKRKLITMGAFYLSVGMGSLSWIYYGDNGADNIVWLFLVVAGMDVGGYIVGCSLKGPKLMPKVSPNKTWSGLLGGILFAVILSSLMMFYFQYRFEDFAMTIMSEETFKAEMFNIYFIKGAMAVAIAIFAQAGDLVESAIKRSIGIKDSGCIIPGHGGCLDRFDGILLAAPMFCLIDYIFSII